jgi:hypothetical protein
VLELTIFLGYSLSFKVLSLNPLLFVSVMGDSFGFDTFSVQPVFFTSVMLLS